MTRSSRRRPFRVGRLPTESASSLTVLSANSTLLTKVIGRDGGIDPVDRTKFFEGTPVDVSDFGSAVELLRELESCPNSAIVLGAIAAGTDRTRMRRLYHATKHEPATLLDVPRILFPFDLDTVGTPIGFDRTNLDSAAKTVRDAMPKPFRTARCVAVATSGYLIKSGLRFRLWFFLDEPMTCAMMKRWLHSLRAPVDFQPLHPAGLNYTAAPIFENPSHDPLPNGRIVILDGSERVKSPDLHNTPEMRERVSTGSPLRLRGGTSALIRATVTIRAAEQGERHNTIIRAAHRLADAVEQGSVSEKDAEVCLREASVRVGMPDAETTAISRHVLTRKRDRFPFKDERQK